MSEKTVEGSIVLLVLIVMGMLMLLMHGAMTRQSFFKMTVATRAYQKKNMVLCRSLLRYGVRVAQDNYDIIYKKSGQEVALEFPLDQKKVTIFLAPASDGITIRSALWQGNSVISKCSCRLTQNSDKKFTIACFQR
jgi:hypothetical protein